MIRTKNQYVNTISFDTHQKHVEKLEKTGKVSGLNEENSCDHYLDDVFNRCSSRHEKCQTQRILFCKKKVYAQTCHREYSLGQNERIHRAKIPQRKMKTNARIPPTKKRGKKQINHF